MLAGPELLIFGAIIAVVVVFVLIVAGPFRERSGLSDSASKTITLPERGDAWLARVATSLSGLPAHRVEWPAANSLQLYWTRRPVWTYVVAVVFFPLGLLALLFTTTLTGTLRVIETGPPAEVEFAGDFSNVAVELVNRAIPD